MDMLGALFILLVATLVVASICLGLCIGLAVKIFMRRDREKEA